MMLIFLALVFAALPLLFLSSFTKLAFVSTYAGLAHLLLLAVVLYIIWFSMRHQAIFRAWRRRSR